MVSPVVKYKFWDSASYDGLGTTSGDYFPSLETELDAWITAISGNASMTGYLPVKQKGVAGSTNANQIGFTISCPHATGTTISVQAHTTSATGRAIRLGYGWTDSGSNGGYGTLGTQLWADSCSWDSTGYDQGILLAYDTTDEKEFFMAGAYSSRGNVYSDSIITLIRGTAGQWGLWGNDGGGSQIIWWNETNSSVTMSQVHAASARNATFGSSYGEGGIGPGASFVSANTRVFTQFGTTSTGAYSASGSYSAYSTGTYGPVVVVG